MNFNEFEGNIRKMEQEENTGILIDDKDDKNMCNTQHMINEIQQFLGQGQIYAQKPHIPLNQEERRRLNELQTQRNEMFRQERLKRIMDLPDYIKNALLDYLDRERDIVHVNHIFDVEIPVSQELENLSNRDSANNISNGNMLSKILPNTRIPTTYDVEFSHFDEHADRIVSQLKCLEPDWPTMEQVHVALTQWALENELSEGQNS